MGCMHKVHVACKKERVFAISLWQNDIAQQASHGTFKDLQFSMPRHRIHLTIINLVEVDSRYH